MTAEAVRPLSDTSEVWIPPLRSIFLTFPYLERTPNLRESERT